MSNDTLNYLLKTIILSNDSFVDQQKVINIFNAPNLTLHMPNQISEDGWMTKIQ